MDDKEIKRILDDAIAFGEALEKCRIDPNKPLKPREYLFSWKGVKFGERGTIMNVRGFPGIGKTFAVTAFCLAFLNGDKDGLKCYAKDGEKILYIDPYDHPDETDLFVERIKRECSFYKDKLFAYNNERMLTMDKQYCIKALVRKHKPSLIIVDGMEGLIPEEDVNNTKRIDLYVSPLLELAKESNALIITTNIYYGTGSVCESLNKGLTNYMAAISRDEFTLTMRRTKNQNRYLSHKSRGIEIERITFRITNAYNRLGKVTIIK